MKINEISKNIEETYNLGIKFSKELSAGSVTGLIGDLASGKTTFVKGILKGFNYLPEVTSPTFTLINDTWIESTTFYKDLPSKKKKKYNT